MRLQYLYIDQEKYQVRLQYLSRSAEPSCRTIGPPKKAGMLNCRKPHATSDKTTWTAAETLRGTIRTAAKKYIGLPGVQHRYHVRLSKGIRHPARLAREQQRQMMGPV